MTVTTSANKSVMAGNGTLGAPGTPFTFTFNAGYALGATSPTLAKSYLTVIYTDAAGVETVVAQGSGASQCQITLNAAVSPNLWGAGGSIVYQPGGSPIASGTSLTVYRTIPLLQLIVLLNQGSYGQNAQNTEMMGDIVTMLVQQLGEENDRALKMSITNSRAPVDLPPAAQMAGKALIGSADGLDVIAGQIPSGGVISSAMQPVVAAASLAAGRTAFGLGGMAVEGIGTGLADDGAGSVRVVFPTTAVATNQAIGASAALKQYIATGPINFTLARANTLWSGFGFWVEALADAVTLIPDANDSLPGRASGESLAIPAGCAAWVTTNAASSGTWLVFWMPQLAPQFNGQLAKSGANLQLSRSGGRLFFINGRNEVIPASGPTVAPPATTLTRYYVYAYMNGVTMTLESVTTAPAIDPTYGHPIKTGDASRSLVGQGRTVASAWVDTAAQRFVRSYYNDPGIATSAALTADRTVASATFVEVNAEIKNEFLSWSGEIVNVQGAGTINSSSDVGYVSIAFDGVAPEDTANKVISTSVTGAYAVGTFKTGLTEDYHYVTLIGKVATGNMIFEGAASAGERSTLKGTMRR